MRALLVLVAACWLAGHAHAEGVVSTGLNYLASGQSGTGVAASTWAGAVANYCTRFTTVTGGAPCDAQNITGGVPPNASACGADIFTTNPQGAWIFYTNVSCSTTPAGCPPNSSLVGGQCVCDTGYSPNEDATACVAPSPETLCKAGNVIASPGGDIYSVPRLTTFVCDGTCAARAKAAAEMGGKFWAWGPLVLTGGLCNPNDPTIVGNPDPPTPDPLKPGYCPGTVNGVEVQVPCKTTATGKETKIESAATPASGASAAGTGTTTQRTETRCTDGVCTTTTTTVNSRPDGTSDTTKREEQSDEKSICEENPQLAMCKEGRFGGTCGGSFSCDGDAIQCAIAREQHVRNCAFFQPAGALAAEGESLLSTGGARPAEHPWLSPVTRSFGSGFGAESNLIGAGACPADLTVPVPGRPSLVISFTPLCGAASWLGNLLVGITALACIGIVFIGGKRGA